MNKTKSILIIIPFIIIIFGFSIINIISKDKDISEAENRTLAQMPELKDRNFRSKYEEYYADQFLFRDKILKIYTKSQVNLNKTKVRDYYTFDNEWILESPEVKISDEEINESSTIINEYAKYFSEKGKDVYYISMPHKTNALNHMYPKYIDSEISVNQKDKFLSTLDRENINVLDLSKEFNQKFSKDELEKFYFKTDHHWNSIGAFEGFKIMSEYINEKSNTDIKINDNDYETYTLDKKTFIGSYNLNLYKTMSTNESIPYVYKKGTEKYEYRKSYDGTWFAPTDASEIVARFVNEDEVVYSGAYTYDDHYYQIINENALTDKKALVIRDSYHSAMSWMLGDIFKEVVVVDPRHIEVLNLTPSEIATNSDADIVLFMYNDLSGTKVIPELKN